MSALVKGLRQRAEAQWVAWRRARNLRHGARAMRIGWTAALCALLAAGGAAVIAGHARQLGSEAAPPPSVAALEPLRPLLAGVSFTVPEQPGATLTRHGAATLVVVSGMQGATPAEFDLCAPGPVRIGYTLEQAARLARPGKLALAAGVPRVEVSGAKELTLRWQGAAQFAGDGAQETMRHDGWLVWDGGALHFKRRPAPGCAAGRLAVRLYRPGGKDGAQVAAYTDGASAAAWLRPGRYTVPALPARRLEDEALFHALQARGMLRLGADGLVEVIPRDLPAWRRAPPAQHAAQLSSWADVELDQAGLALHERLYRMADGAYLRAQLELFNSERRLLAWRVRPQAHDAWQAGVGQAPAPLADGMPLAGTRLFAELPSGWAPWRRIARWPHAGRGVPARLSLELADGAPLELMLAGRLLDAEGASVQARDACSGRACAGTAAVQVLRLLPAPGSRRVVLTAAPLDMAAIAGPGDEEYRHLRVAGGKLVWRPLPAAQALARAASPAPVTLRDRHGQVLWSAGAPTEAARTAGLATLLGAHAQHANSVAGMLARLPGGGHQASLTLDLGMQALAQAALDCVGLRQGRWQGGRCAGAHPAPPGRQAGMIILDTASGEILAAAGAGAAEVTQDNWAEVRAFDAANPAASPLRVPSLQHDGGIHRSPGSAFKIVSALGLELAAREDGALAALLEGMPLAGINQLAHERGYAFRTAAASYPHNAGARITNYRDAHLDGRAADGRLGLAQALTYSFNTWFAWTQELSDRTLFGRPEDGLPGVRALDPAALAGVRPIAAMAHRLGFGTAMRLDGGLLPDDYPWAAWDALQARPSRIDPIDTRHELRQMAIGLRMQATPLQMALAAGAVGEGALVSPRLLLSLDGREAVVPARTELGVRLDRIRAGLKGVVDGGTAAEAFRDPILANVRRGLSGKTGTAPAGQDGGSTVWFTGWLEPGSLPGERRRLALAVFISHSQATGGEHAAPVAAAVLRALAIKSEQKGK